MGVGVEFYSGYFCIVSGGALVGFIRIVPVGISDTELRFFG
jgi:hypothetical protein